MPLPWLEKPEIDLDEFYKEYAALVDHLSAMRNGSAVEFWQRVAGKLSQALEREKPYTWRYPSGVYKRDIKPSHDFVRAVKILLAEVDGLPVEFGRLESVQIYASRGVVHAGSVVMAASVPCANRACNRIFVPNVPWRIYCPFCKPPKK
jgi:hypothetical protein